MGLLKDLKKRVNTGGIKVKLEAPNTVSVADEYLDAVIIISSSDEPQEIKNVYLEFELERRESNIAEDDDDYQEFETFTVARVDSGPMSIAANDEKRLPVRLPLAGLARTDDSIDLGDNAAANLAEGLLRLNRNSQFNESYQLLAGAELEDMRDPTANQRMNVTHADGSTSGGGFGFQVG